MDSNCNYTEFLSKLDYQSLIRMRSTLDIEDKNILGMIDQEIEIRLLEQTTKKEEK